MTTTLVNEGPPSGPSARQVSLVFDGSQSAPLTRAHLERLRAGGIDALHLTLGDVHSDFVSTVRAVARARQLLAELNEDVLLVERFDDFARARAGGRIGIVFALQHAPIEAGAEDIEALHALGVRTLQLTYNARNPLGDGAAEPRDGGISRMGRRMVQALNVRGVTVDLSHCGDRTTREAIEASSQPVLITHANALAVCDCPRNKSDATLQALAKNGGVIGASFWSPMTHNGLGRRPTIDEFLRQVEYLVRVCGIDHVGIGSDIGEGQSREKWDASFAPGGRYASMTDPLRSWFNYETRMVDGLETASKFKHLRVELGKRGYTDQDVAQLLGGNFLRVFSTAWC